jgi:hypothetical protein
VCVSLLFTEPLFPECALGCYVRCGCSSSTLIFTVEVCIHLFFLGLYYFVSRLVASCLVLVFLLVWLLVFFVQW